MDKEDKEQWINADIEVDMQYASPEAGIKAMQERIAHLRERLREVNESSHLADDTIADRIAELRPQLNDARQQLTRYEALLKSRN